VNQNRQSVDQFVRDVLGDQWAGDFVQNAGQVEEALFEHEITASPRSATSWRYWAKVGIRHAEERG
jgi:hypothetical protein